jgi:hypothetical protein
MAKLHVFHCRRRRRVLSRGGLRPLFRGIKYFQATDEEEKRFLTYSCQEYA